MFALAKSGDTKRIAWCFNRMNAMGLKPNMHSYVAALISVGKHPNNHRNTVMRIIIDCKKSNLNVLELATSVDYSSEQMTCIRNALNLVFPGFEFVQCEDLTRTHPLLCKLKRDKDIQEAETNNKHIKSNETKSTEEPLFPEINDKTTILDNFENQIRIEKKFLIEVPTIYEEAKLSAEKTSKYKGNLNRRFREQATKHFIHLTEQMKESTKASDTFLLPFLLVMDKSIYIDLIMKEIEILAQMSEFYSNTFHHIANEIGKRVENRFQKHCLGMENDFDKIQANYSKYVDYMLEKYADPQAERNSHREEWMEVMRRDELFTVSKLMPLTNINILLL